MNRYFIYLSYDGTNYCGWQRQPNGLSVQEVIEKNLSVLFRCDMNIVGAGRTDAGVHARMMIAHFDAEQPIDNLDNLKDRLNGMLPYDVAIKKIEEVASDAHARFDATSRLYRYYVVTEKDPFLKSTHFRLRGTLDVDAMNECADVLFEYTDFTSFSKLHTDVKTNDCEIMYARWEKLGNQFVFTIKANRFLRNMVRAIVGTLIDVGKGKLSKDDFRKIIETKNRNVAGVSVPGHALFLEEVEYKDRIRL